MFTRKSRPSVHRSSLGCACALLLAAGCGDGPTDTTPTPPPLVPPALRIVAGEGASDTVDALLPALLQARVTDERGVPVAGVPVQFTAALVPGSATVAGVQVRGTAGTYERTVSTSTDASGMAWVNVALGPVAGPAQVVVSAPGLALADTAAFTVQPGAAAQLRLAPRDTAVYVDGSFALRTQPADRRGNAVTAALSYTVRGAAATAAGGTVRGAVPGRTYVVAESGSVRDSVAVSVVPRGVLVARRGGLHRGLVTFGLDGSDYRLLRTDQAVSPRFTPDGTILFTDWDFGDLHRMAPDGAVQKYLAEGNPIPAVTWPHPSRDGEWIYFTQFDEHRSTTTPSRVRRDGTGLEMVPGMDRVFNRGHFSPSPDGTHFAYFMERFNSRDVVVRVSPIGSSRVLAEVPGHTPEWSPTGEWIAYVFADGRESGPLRAIRPDGTGMRDLADPSRSYLFGMDWSPDGKWIVAATSIGLELVNAESGLIIPLPFAAELYEPSWKP